jgi:hypothetical protein
VVLKFGIIEKRDIVGGHIGSIIDGRAMPRVVPGLDTPGQYISRLEKKRPLRIPTRGLFRRVKVLFSSAIVDG